MQMRLCVAQLLNFDVLILQDTLAMYIMWRLRVTAAVDEVSGRSVEYRQLCPSVWVEKDILIKMATRSWSSWKPDVDCVLLHIS